MTENKKILASVNDKEISQEDVIAFISKMQGGNQFLNPQGINQITDELVNQELMYIDAKENKLDEDEEFLRELDITKSNMLKNYAMHLLFKDIKVDEVEIREYYDNNKEIIKKPKTYKASHILVEDENMANKILKEIKGGRSFEDAADKYSIDKGSKGGDLGEFPKGTMVKEFEDALEKLSEGEISEPVKSQFGYHIIKLDHVHESFLPEFDEIKDRIHDTLLMIKRQEKYLEKVGKIKEKVEVKKYY
ncbi:peptidylprolyl isomerase [Anaerococcus sp. AGMB00486]|uniref:peptidylprolyl isomerase n=2 Tax=Anaerococcus TaxID=165779 RepID=A0ABX2N7P0_9FIRM|nr:MULTISPECIES: peptidylprolyl isomerase [Anaerococcus]MDY3007229.1 peptidylprolyl isomerase [Anaerococcus porci]MSS76853.1 peptidylprolyl isomerase [Anaerococcus porci]NVF10663.1 peptidylprolyl isomerase [Anaerococcus faecalis]